MSMASWQHMASTAQKVRSKRDYPFSHVRIEIIPHNPVTLQHCPGGQPSTTTTTTTTTTTSWKNKKCSVEAGHHGYISILLFSFNFALFHFLVFLQYNKVFHFKFIVI
jgi:hypothetical protein